MPVPVPQPPFIILDACPIKVNLEDSRGLGFPVRKYKSRCRFDTRGQSRGCKHYGIVPRKILVVSSAKKLLQKTSRGLTMSLLQRGPCRMVFVVGLMGIEYLGVMG